MEEKLLSNNKFSMILGKNGIPLRSELGNNGKRIYIAKGAKCTPITPKKQPAENESYLDRKIVKEITGKQFEQTLSKKKETAKELIWTPKNYKKIKNHCKNTNDLLWSREEYRQMTKEQLIFTTRQYIESLNK